MKNYCYLVVNTLDRTAIAIDAAWDVQSIYRLADELGVKIKGSIYTHFHFDHCGGDVEPMFTGGRRVEPLAGAKEVEEAGGEVWAGVGDVDLIMKQCKLSKPISGLGDGDFVECGDLVLHAISTPGHTPGSVCIFAAPRCLSPRNPMGASSFITEKVTQAESGLLLTGDTLFVGSSGATHFPGGSQEEMHRSLARLSKLDANVVVCPGHAYSDPFTTIGRERDSNRAMLQGLIRVPRPPALPPCVACGLSGAACGPKGFIIGRKVRIEGLASDAGQALNGLRGVVQGFTADKERYAVKLLTSGEVKALKGANIEKSTVADGDASVLDTVD